MEEMTLYADIAQRTGGAVMLGVVGPVRTGKSTFIKRFMETAVIPNIDNEYVRERAKDELPQSGSGRMIMTSEPKFVPEEAVAVSLEGGVQLSVRLGDDSHRNDVRLHYSHVGRLGTYYDHRNDYRLLLRYGRRWRRRERDARRRRYGVSR